MKSENNEKKQVYVICTNHFDPIWRRGFKEPFYWEGQKFVGDDKIQEACISDWIEMSKGSDSKFEVECSLVLRTYLESHPEQLEYVKKLINEERMELLASGEVIPDTNMPGGETLVRNLMYGILWGEDTFGVTPSTGCLNDSFGSSAQLPQIFKGCGVDWLIGLSYCYISGDYWKGLDGTIIRALNNPQDPRFGDAKYLGYGTYYRPCPVCKGEGCIACNYRGFDQWYRMQGEVNAEGFTYNKRPFGLVFVGGEETMAPMDLPDRVKKANESDGNNNYQFGIYKQIARKYFKDDIENTENCDPARIAPETEANPAQTGCYVSRIKIKQNVRRLENNTAAVEKLSALSYLNGGRYNYDEFTENWRKISFAAFHDCITGTHVDAGYKELTDAFRDCDQNLGRALQVIKEDIIYNDDRYITVFNPHGFEATDYVRVNTEEAGEIVFRAEKIPPLGFKLYKVSEILAAEVLNNKMKGDKKAVFGEQKFIENEFYKVTTDEHGITGIYDKQLDKELIKGSVGYANEIILEHDFGDPWSTREDRRPRFRLGHMGDLTGIKRYDNYSEITYKGSYKGNEDVLQNPSDYRVLHLEWEQKVILWDSLKKVDFVTNFYWDTFDRRIRISFPTYMTEDDGYYAIPYGTLKRKRYDRKSSQGISNPDGEWPSIEWFSTAKDKDVNIALLNKGTPSSRIENGEMMISVLRSPSFPSCLLWPKVYNAPVYDGMRDQGWHKFEYSLTSFNDNWSTSDVVRDAYAYNSKLMAFNGALKGMKHGVSLKAEGTEIAAVKKAEKGEGIIVRLNEYRGMSETVELILPQNVTAAYEVNLVEKKQKDLVIKDGKLSLEMNPFKLKTIKLEFDK